MSRTRGFAAPRLAWRGRTHDTRAVTPLRLPMLEPHRAALETCVYCPKLSRAVCPVSNAEHSETLTPWGKMSLAWFAARGDVPIDADHAAPAWACTSCFACRERCDHRNEVGPVLTDARADFFAAGVAPEGARRVAEVFAHVTRAIEAALSAAFGYDKLNYLLLMMVDPDVHFHVLPRYGSEREFAGVVFPDPGFPGPPRLDQSTAVDEATLRELVKTLRCNWPE